MVNDIFINEKKGLNTPVLFMIFSRPSTTRLVFEAIRQARPSRLYIAADGPRANKPGEAEKCRQSREIATSVTWDCEVHTLFRDTNLGCGEAATSAINWFFEHETEGIILEDDCLPSQSFFHYCTELLEKYRDDTRVFEIAGTNFEKPAWREQEYSYTFSSLASIWGWATWRRAWMHHDFRMRQYKEISEKQYLMQGYRSLYEREFFEYIFRYMYESERKKTWDYQWQFACSINSGITIVPVRNLIKNIGFGEFATHTTDPESTGHDLVLEAMDFPLVHPEFMMVNNQRDALNFNLMHTSRASRIKSVLKQLIPKAVLEKMIKPLRDLLSFERKLANVPKELFQQES